MKTRIIKTRLWSNDDKFGELNPTSKLVFLYCITNERIGMSGMYECPDRMIKFEVGISEPQLQTAKEELTSKKMVLFNSGWIYVVNAEKHNNYRNSPLNEVFYQKEVSLIPDVVRSGFDSSIDSSVGGSMHTNQKQEIRNNKQEILNKKDIIDELKKQFPNTNVNDEIDKMKDWLASKGKVQKDYVAFARNWLRRASATDRRFARRVVRI